MGIAEARTVAASGERAASTNSGLLLRLGRRRRAVRAVTAVAVGVGALLLVGPAYASTVPVIGSESVGNVHAESAELHAAINPEGSDTTYHFEYGTGACSVTPDPCSAVPVPDVDIGSGTALQNVSVQLSGLQPATVYRYRVLANNEASPAGGTSGPERTFTTLPFIPPLNDSCPNAHVRQQTGAAQLLDCRAYELVSAADTGGYDVESNLVSGQAPFGGYPQADSRVLYGVHNGAIPGTNHPTNKGLDPYIATRGNEGWSTEYVGIPANDPEASASDPFSSVPSGADASLHTLAFGAPGGCSPCFGGGSTGIPVRRPDGELVQGMAGSLNPGPSAEPAGQIAKDLSANGEHFVFGSTSQFEPDGNHNGDVSIYDRNLVTEMTHVVSKTPAGVTLTGPGIAELDISSDGSHVLIGQKVGADPQGNPYYHLYMNVEDSAKTIDLTPGASDGVLYDGMSGDGSRVFFTTKDALSTAANPDSDTSADLYEAEVSAAGATLNRISAGSEGTGNTDSCDPAANSADQHWNTSSGEANCGVVAIGGGGGVASGDGTIYFLSPERLDGSANGIQNAPNLYIARPGDGYAPHYVTTLESILTGPQPPQYGRSLLRNFGSFSDATGIAVDHSSGTVYVLDVATNTVRKFDSSGNPVNFSASAGYLGANAISGTPAGPFSEIAEANLPTQLAVDQSTGDLYVPDTLNNVVDKFSPSGEYLSQVGVALASAVAVDPANGNLYVGSLFGTVFVFDSAGNPVSSFPVSGAVRGVGVDSSGSFYVASGAETNAYNASGEFVRQLDPNPSESAGVDSATGDVYIDEGAQIARYDSSGTRLASVGSGVLSGSVGFAVEPGGNLYASNAAARVASFGPFGLLPRPSVDNPLVLDSVGEPAARRPADFQLSANGDFAAFPSSLALAQGGEESAEHSEVFRYAADAARLSCISCTSTGAPSAGDSSLSSSGLSLAEDGRVFFNSTDQLVSADTDGRQDVYEFSEPGAGNCDSSSTAYEKASGDCLALISAGTSPFDAGLLSTSSNGTDAFFFTRDSLAPQDQNGATMKIYDGRAGGGFPFTPPAIACQASDECHGAGSPAPGPVEVASLVGTEANLTKEKTCKRGFVKRHGTCARVHHHRRAKHKHGAHK